ncbi:hypothetical protein CBR_g39363 [Chara braunii]|uniref:Fucosyltransferase n=1 Tax=Chara braunii TaxID=69332 RepID=A0A388LRS7_CHABU|nr:hypothetical protein CBR_g39363 [Chara braunii]|eukprot:GBG84902.1 hypothetical protein CBR_g39363 [Chara braunii]
MPRPLLSSRAASHSAGRPGYLLQHRWTAIFIFVILYVCSLLAFRPDLVDIGKSDTPRQTTHPFESNSRKDKTLQHGRSDKEETSASDRGLRRQGVEDDPLYMGDGKLLRGVGPQDRGVAEGAPNAMKDTGNWSARVPEVPAGTMCEAWLTEKDRFKYGRDFSVNPIRVGSLQQKVWEQCSVGCVFSPTTEAVDGNLIDGRGASDLRIVRTMESETNYPMYNVDAAHSAGFSVVMTTNLNSDVPVGYFSWAEYDIMTPPQVKDSPSAAVAFISNCAARTFRLAAIEHFQSLGVGVDSYGGCKRNKPAGADKQKTLPHYKFCLAFENSMEEDYVTEKYFQCLVAGSVPVVIGAPNIDDFEPAPGSHLRIASESDMDAVAQRITQLMVNEEEYERMLRWKREGPSDKFLALVDMAAVHSSCRLCIFLATRFREQEEKDAASQWVSGQGGASDGRPCRCRERTESGEEVTVYHLYVRERGRFEFESVFLRSGALTEQALKVAVLRVFTAKGHVPVWKNERPPILARSNVLRVYSIYPVWATQRAALYGAAALRTDEQVAAFVHNKPCGKLEVIFV